ncbi:cysteine hydrolase family protein [Arenibaculum sp.]|jgi:nicotinamidase-related amidase|uniref:cysteine hydrolase family protein n=1 Tax=Arenibaculum sp. TaxID=2865862 RepID=UPI002E0F9BE9|nr:cysteine hydrolase family protein [Arenibaculum sp.]
MSDRPKTLLQHAGVPSTPGRLGDAVVVLVDFQMEYVGGALRLVGVDAAVAQAAKLLRLARETGTPVFHVVHHGRAGGALFDPEGPHCAIVPDLAPAGDEAVIRKTLPNAFAGTDLADRIDATGRKDLILAGFMTHMCVAATARAALDLGYRGTVVAGATATRDLPDPLGGVVPADAVHRATLAALADRFAVVVTDAAALAS